MADGGNPEETIATPISVLWDGILSVPIVGIIDSMRGQQIMDDMLQAVKDTEAKVIILDILGVPAVDSAVASHLIKITKATRLMGCKCIVCGISPAIAQTMVHLGIDLGDVVTVSRLRDGVKVAFDQLDLRVVRVS